MQKIIFFGDDQYSAIVLTELIHDTSFTIVSVVTATPKPVGRAQQIIDNPVEIIAKKAGLNILYYPDNKSDLDNFLTPLKKDTNDATGVLASFGKILPKELIELFAESGILCLHPSLLPQYRGATPAPYAIALGDTETGITLFRLTSEVDQGEIIATSTEPILPSDTTPTLLTRLFTIGSSFLIRYFNAPHSLKAQSSKLKATPIFTRRFSRDTGFVEWGVVQSLLSGKPLTPAETKNPLLLLRLLSVISSVVERSNTRLIVHDLIRALTPWPGVWTIATTNKGDLRLTLVSVLPEITVKIAGKKNPIPWSEFEKYYLD